MNDILGPNYRPDLKDAVILGNAEMQERAKIILSRQLNEVVDTVEENVSTEEEQETDRRNKNFQEDEHIGEVMTKR